MYQKIDDISAGEAAQDTKPAKARGWLFGLVLIGFSVMLAAAIWKYTQKPPSLTHPSEQAAAIDAFNRIQLEASPAIRRARLIDYIANHPASPVILGAKQQLRVMNDYEAKDWSALSDIMFSETLSPTDKQFELERFTARWGEGLVGTRDDDLAALRLSLQPSPEAPKIDRAHKPEGSPIPQTIDGTQMAGGHQTRPVLPRYPVQPVSPATVQPQIRKPEVTPLRVRRNRRPDYPRKAYSRGVAAIVELSLNIDEKGRVRLIETIDVDAARYERDFERAARRAARGTRFYPREEDGRPVPVRNLRKTYVFDPEQ